MPVCTIRCSIVAVRPNDSTSWGRPVVVDENVIIGRFFYDIPQFVDAIVAQLN
jgi:hypothetical protein